jgi:GNAT superfamily N-acetyltransferase
VELVWRFLSEESYWAFGIPRELVVRSIANSMVFGAYLPGRGEPKERQIGFARVVTDQATFAYLADVFVLKPYRGQGIAKQLLIAIQAHPDLQGLRRWMLATADAHALYEQFGFASPSKPQNLMELRPKIGYGSGAAPGSV